MSRENILTLREMDAGQEGVVIAFTGDRDSRERLVSMGVTPGCSVKLLLKSPGRYLVAINESRIALGPEMAQDVELVVEESADTFSQAVARLKQIWGH